MEEYLSGRTAKLIIPYKGYENIEIIEQSGCRWLVETSSGMQLEVYEDEFELEEPR